MPKEKLVASRPLLKSPVELTELPGEGITQIQVVANHLSFPGTRRDTIRTHGWARQGFTGVSKGCY